MPEIQIKGAGILAYQLDQFSRGTSMRILRNGLRAAGKVFDDRLTSEAPKRTGRMARTVRIISSRATSPSSAYVRIGTRGTKALFNKDAGVKLSEVKHGGRQGHYYTRKTKSGNRRVGKLRYWHLVISGTKPHRIGGIVVINGKVFAGVDHPGSAANPFVRRAFNASKQQAVDAFFDDVNRQVREWAVVLPKAA